MAAKNKVEVDYLTNAKQMLGELRQMNAELRNVRDNVQRLHSTGTKGATAHKSAIAGLALRFVGYNMVLNQVMGAQQKMIEYVKESITKYREFQTRIAEVSTIMGQDFQDAIIGLKAGVESLSLSFGKNTSDMSKGLYDIMSAAFSAKEAIALLGSATKAAIAGIADVRESVDIFTTVLNTYGMSAYEATWVSDMLFQSVVRGKFQFQELESALGYVVPIAAQAGIAFDELMAALSTATRHGLHLDMASRGLAMAIQNVINPSEGAAKAARKYGIELSGLAIRVKGLTGFFKELSAKADEYGKVILTELIPNIRSLRVVMVLAGEEGLEGLIDDMDRLAIASGRTEEALAKIMDTSEFVSNQIQQQWEQTQREVGKDWDKLALSIQAGMVEVIGNLPSFLPVIGSIFTGMKAASDIEFMKWRKETEAKYGVGEYTTTIPGASERLKELNAELLLNKAPSKRRDDLLEEKKLLEGMATVTAKRIRPDYPTEVMGNYLRLQNQIADQAKEINSIMLSGGEGLDEAYTKMLALQTISVELQEDFNAAFGEPIMGGIRKLEDLHVKLDEINFDIERLRTALEKEVTWGWGAFAGKVEGELNYKYKVLEAEQKNADVRHDVQMGLKDSTYGYKVLNSEMQEAIRIVREHTVAQKEDREETQRMNVAMRELQIRAAMIQLAGLSRRRGLTRNEQKQLKKIQIEQLKLRIENMKATKDETILEYDNYLDKKKMIDEYLAKKAEESYQLKYTYDQQLIDMELLIKSEGDNLLQRGLDWQTTTDDIVESATILTESLKEIIGDPTLLLLFENFGIKIQDILDKAQELARLANIEAPAISRDTPATFTAMARTSEETKAITAFRRQKMLMGFERGIEYVPETMPAMIHRGETILPAGSDEGMGGNVTINNTVYATINNKMDARELAALLAEGERSTLMRNGKTTMRTR